MVRPKLLVFIVPIIWLGFGLRVHELGAVPLRGDEAFSAFYWSDIPLTVSLTQIATIEPHPPLAYIVFRNWRHLVGGIDSPFSLRMLTVLGNLIGIAAVCALARRLTGKWDRGVAAALFWAVHPFEIWHSQDFRNYAIWAGMSVTSLWLGLRVISRSRVADWFLYGVTSLFSMMLFYTEVFMIPALGLYAIAIRGRKHATSMRLIALQGLLVTVVTVTFLVIQADLVFSGSYGGNVESLSLPDYLTRFVPALTVGDILPRALDGVWIPICFLLFWLALAIAKNSKREFLFVAAVAIFPLLLIGAVSLRVNLFHPRYVLAAAPAFILVIALGSCHIAESFGRTLRVSPWLLLVVILLPWWALSALSLDLHFNNPRFRKSPAWDQLAEFLHQRVTADDLVIQLSADPAFGYYYDGDAPDIALPAYASQDPAEIEAALNAVRARYDSFYVVSNANPSWPNANVVERWMQDRLQGVLLTDTDGLGIRQYKEWHAVGQDMTTRARFGNVVELVSYRLFGEPLPTGEILLWAYWRPIGRTEQPLKSFAHLYGGINPASGTTLWTQADQFPQYGRKDSVNWELLEVFRDVFYLPAVSLDGGHYDMSLGWYDPGSGERLLVRDGTDTFTLERLTVGG